MFLTSWLKSLRSTNTVGRTDHTRRLCGGAAVRFRPRLEAMEERAVPAALVQPDAATQAQVSHAYGQLPLSFEANQGQTDAQVNFLSRGAGYSLFLTPAGAVMNLSHSSGNDTVLKMQLVGANPAARSVGLDPLAGKVNYLVGNDPSEFHTNISTYGRVEYQNVYTGIDLVYYGNQGQLEYDFLVAPGADTKSIRLSFQGADGLSLDAQGNLLVHTAAGDLVEHAPVLYQEIGGVKQAVSGRYALDGNGQVGFQVGAYDHARPLVIDPVASLVYSSFLGGSGDDIANGVAVDAAGNAYVTGTASSDFPATNTSFPHSPQQNVFVAKLNAAGTGFVYLTVLGGNSNDHGVGIAVDSAGDAYVTGQTTSTNFPTMNGFQTTSGGATDAFLFKLNPYGSALLYSTYLGGSGVEDNPTSSTTGSPGGIAIDNAGNAYLTGSTTSRNFPIKNALKPTSAGYTYAFVTKVDTTRAGSSSLIYSTFLGATNGGDVGYGIAVDSTGHAYVTGSATSNFPTTTGAFQTANAGSIGLDAFVAKLSSDGTSLVYSTYLGGTDSEIASAIAVDAAGNAYVTGQTQSNISFPTTASAFQTSGSGFLTELNGTGTGLTYSTYLGGFLAEGRGVALDGNSHVFVTGSAINAPTKNAFQTFPGITVGNGLDAFVAEFDLSLTGDASLLYASYLGGSGSDIAFGIAADGSGNAYVVGRTYSTNFPTVNAIQATNAGGYDAFVTKIAPPAAPHPEFVVSGFPSTPSAGTAGTFTVAARDTAGNVITDYVGTVHFSSSDPQAVLPVDYTFTVADQGVATFSVTMKTAGLQYLFATDPLTPGMNADPVSFRVNPAAATHFVLSGPTSTKAGTAFSLTLTALDAFGNVATGYVGTVHATSSDTTAVLPVDYTFTAADEGVVTFTGLKLKKKGNQTITFTDRLSTSVLGSLTIQVT